MGGTDKTEVHIPKSNASAKAAGRLRSENGSFLAPSSDFGEQRTTALLVSELAGFVLCVPSVESAVNVVSDLDCD